MKVYPVTLTHEHTHTHTHKVSTVITALVHAQSVKLKINYGGNQVLKSTRARQWHRKIVCRKEANSVAVRPT